MAELKIGTVGDWRLLSPILAAFRLRAQDGSPFPDYRPGQYIALRREDCRLTRREVGPDGTTHFVPVLDEQGRPKRGPVTHSYSIASAPCETREHGWLEFYVVLESDEYGEPGRLTESLFRIHPPEDDKLAYVDRIVGNFTLDERARGARSVLMVGTGTGLAPFLSMVRQLHHDAARGRSDQVRYTLVHTNRTRDELGFHEELLGIARARRFDFVYLPSVSRPAPADFEDPQLGRGRANNLLRDVFGLPLREQELLDHVRVRGGDVAAAERALDKAVRPALPRPVSAPELGRRLEPGETVVLTCGNPTLMDDIHRLASAVKMRFEKEDW
jgi:ferredoxin-NADP reductase